MLGDLEKACWRKKSAWIALPTGGHQPFISEFTKLVVQNRSNLNALMLKAERHIVYNWSSQER
jgi:hypothetical protein